jgi:hypothetical protein
VMLPESLDKPRLTFGASHRGSPGQS